ncbi:hypothetical protein FB451DRAFT_1292982 [Mycena latifolia]|nr:hypothetical protein FB451DRAFT_1292982 [Mycena latifolia]
MTVTKTPRTLEMIGSCGSSLDTAARVSHTELRGASATRGGKGATAHRSCGETRSIESIISSKLSHGGRAGRERRLQGNATGVNVAGAGACDQTTPHADGAGIVGGDRVSGGVAIRVVRSRASGSLSVARSRTNSALCVVWSGGSGRLRFVGGIGDTKLSRTGSACGREWSSALRRSSEACGVGWGVSSLSSHGGRARRERRLEGSDTGQDVASVRPTEQGVCRSSKDVGGEDGEDDEGGVHCVTVRYDALVRMVRRTSSSS